MSTTIESLELQVQSSASSAVGGIDALTASLSKLKNATKGGVGLTSVANQLRNLNTALQSVDSSSADKIDKLANSLNKLKSLGNIKISSSIGNQLKNIGSAASALNTADLSGIGRLATALQPLNNIGKASGLESAIKQLNKLPQLAQTLNGVDWKSFTSQIQSMSSALTPLVNQLNAVSTAFNRLPSNIRNVVSATNNVTQANNGASKSYVNLAAKIATAWVAIKQLARGFADVVSQSVEWDGITYRFGRAFGESAQEAYQWIQKLNKELHINTQLFMQYASIYGTMLTGYGVAQKDAATMAMGYAELTYDIWAGFNDVYKSYEDAAVAVRSAIAGEVEPIRKAGFTIVDSQLKATAAMYGIEYSTQSATEELKSYLRYLTLVNQAYDQNLVGTYAREMNTAEGLLRTLRQQLYSLAQTFGSIFLPILAKVLPVVQVFVALLKELVVVIANLFGVDIQPVDFSKTFSSAETSTGGIADNLGDATTAAKKLKSYMLGIDELNVISPTDSSGVGGAGGAGGGDYSGLFDLDKLWDENIFKEVNSQVNEIVNKVKEWLGLNEEINSWSDFFHTRLGKILTTVGAIGLGLAAWKISKGVLDGLRYISDLKAHGLGNPLTIAVGISLLVTGISLEWAGILDAIRNELDGENFAQIISGGVLTVGGGAFLGKGIATWITTAFADSAVAQALATAATNLGVGSVGAAGAAIGAGVAGIIAGIPAYITGIYDAIQNGLNWLNGLLIPAGSTAAAAGIGAIIGACGGPIGAGIGALIGLAVGLITDGIILITQNWEEITSFLKNFFTVTIPGIWNSFVQWLKNLPETISQWFTDLWQPIKDFDWNQFGHDVGYKVGTAVKNICEAFKTFFTETLPEVWETVKTAFKTFFTETLPKFFTETIPEFWETVKTSFVTFFTETLPEALSNIGEWFVDVGQSIWDGIKEGWDTAVKAVKDFITGFVDGFKEALGIHSPSTVFRDEIGVFLGEGLLEGLLAPFKKIGKWIKTNIIDPIGKAIEDNPISDIVVGIADTASDWWNKAKGWWEDVTDEGVSIEAGVELAKQGWQSIKGWIGKIPTLSQAIALTKEKWQNVKDWIGDIPIVEQGVELVKEKWSSVTEWVGNIPIVEQSVELVKERWSTVREWIGNIPTLSQYIQLLKQKWSTVKEWIGNIPTLSQYIKLMKEKWNSVKEWIGNIPTLSQYIQLLKHKWTSVKNWIGNIPVLNQLIGLLKDKWTTVKNWIGSLPVISQGIGLLKNAWNTVAGWVKDRMGGAVDKNIGLSKTWSTVAKWVSNFIGGAVDVTVNLISKWKGKIKEFFGLSSGGVVSANGGIKIFSTGGSINSRGKSWWDSVPKYATGTPRAGAHGSLFVAGEDGAELVGHVNGTTEVLNRFQLARVMHSSIVSGMAQFTGYWRSLNSQMTVCANAVIRSILVSTESVNANLAYAGGYAPVPNDLAQTVYEDSQRAYDHEYSSDSMYDTMKKFYHDYVEPSMNRMVIASERQADKQEKTEVHIGNRVITESVETQQKANGYKFTK